MEGASPFSMMRRLFDEVDRLFGFGGAASGFQAPLARGTWAPQLDVFEREGQLVMRADLPGMEQNDVRIEVDENVLTISGERKHEHEHESGGVYRCERSYGAFQRSLAIPEGVDPDTIRASFENGVLEVTMPIPTTQAKKGRSIPIGPKPAGGVKH